MARPLFRRPSNRAQIARRQNKVPPALSAPSSVPVLSVPEGISITASGFTPRVTYTYP